MKSGPWLIDVTQQRPPFHQINRFSNLFANTCWKLRASFLKDPRTLDGVLLIGIGYRYRIEREARLTRWYRYAKNESIRTISKFVDTWYLLHRGFCSASALKTRGCQGFDTIYRNFDTIYRKFDTIYRKLHTIYRKFHTIYQKFDTICRKFDTRYMQWIYPD